MEARAEGFRFEAPQAFNMDERIASLFEPDTFLAAQYFGNLRRKTLLEPEKRLMLAILEDAINCYQNNLRTQGSRARRLFTEVEEWILDKGSDWIFSFKSICETLGFNPEYVRQGLLRWKEKKTSKVSSPQILGKEEDCRVRLGGPSGSWMTSTQIESSGGIDAKHRKSLEVTRSSSAGKNAPAPGMEIGNEVRAMLKRWSPGGIPGLHSDHRHESLCSMLRRSSKIGN